MEGTGGGPPAAWGEVPLPGSTAGLDCAGAGAAPMVDAFAARSGADGDAGTAVVGAGPAVVRPGAAAVGAVPVGDPGAGAACGRPDPDGGADAVVVLSVPAVVREVDGAATLPAS
ncbi:hypothetical protein [Arthrobacter bambusae]|uniref:hypothetical protein n=1 Tax=Arthrobacter bambusae TaxID=1338426 RepID=UPI0027838E74|nr:hypothetical protein [Arthrobacter bambusae]MDQ0031650.1 hypothetical protein [Arthrobacter bambusae]MDQ0099874.1 hypothetical protein [Arthrobacter bambusae]